jgi:hypothetical protein
MTDETQRSAAPDPRGPFEWTKPPEATPDSVGTTSTGAEFRGRTPTKTRAVRAGIVAGTGLVLAIGAAVAMGASPSTAPSAGANPAPSGQVAPEQHDKAGHGWMLGGPGRRDRRAFGQISVTAINGSSLSLKTDDGWTRTISVTATTTITKGGQAATLSDVAVGDVIRFAETRNADGTYTITRIDIVVPQVAGVVTAVGNDTITIKRRDGATTTVRTSSSTTYHVGRSNGSRSDVKVGSAIVAQGTKASDGSLDATSVTVIQPRFVGKVTAKTATTITITGPDGTTRTINVSPSTTYNVAGTSGGSLADVSVGMRIVVEGTKQADGSIDASAIAAGRFRGNGGHDRQGQNPDASPAPSASGSTTG